MILLGLMLPVWQDGLAPGVEQDLFPVMVGFGAIFISAMAMLPALIVVVIAEAFRLRSFLFYAVCGGLGMLALYYGTSFGAEGFSPVPRQFEIVAAAGIAAGLFYWLLAGRNAGRWHERPPAAT